MMNNLAINSLLLSISLLSLTILLLIYFLKKLRQPYLIAYVIAGVLLGPYCAGLFRSAEGVADIGSFGIILMMFFIGMDIEIPDTHSALKKPVIAQSIKTLLSGFFVLVLGRWMHWSTANMLLLTGLLVFNSTAVVSDYLQKNNQLYTETGKMILNMLLLQDIMLAPVLSSFNLAGNGISIMSVLMPLIGAVLLLLLLRTARNRIALIIPFQADIDQDHELQVFLGIFLCLGFALLANVLQLPPAIGSFAAGLYISRNEAFNWLEKVLSPFKVFFIALFFVAVGMQVDLSFVHKQFPLLLLISIAVVVINSLLSAIVLRLLRYNWRHSLYAGALLSQTGEFGLVAGTMAHSLHIINDEFYKMMLAVVCISLLLATIWITLLRKMIYKEKMML